jgi:hypothetical protein
MKTLKKVIAENPDKKVLIKAVIDNLGLESVQDVNNHGADGGYGNFIYYTETSAFYQKHKKDINKWLSEMAQEIGEPSTANMVQNFRCLGKDYSIDEISGVIYGNEEQDQIENALAWFALEGVCRLFED